MLYKLNYLQFKPTTLYINEFLTMLIVFIVTGLHGVFLKQQRVCPDYGGMINVFQLLNFQVILILECVKRVTSESLVMPQ